MTIEGNSKALHLLYGSFLGTCSRLKSRDKLFV